MSKLVQRLLIFFIGLPAALAVVFFLPQKNHLAANIVVIILCVLGGAELSVLLKKKNLIIHPMEAAVLAVLVPAAMMLHVSFNVDAILIPGLIVAAMMWLLVSRIFSKGEKLDDALGRFISGLAVMFYPSVFFGWIILMNRLPESTYLILAFLCVVIANDSLAWLAGMLFGKSNRGLIAASPNKSIVGFITGILASTLAGLIFAFVMPGVFIAAHFPPVVSGLALGFLTGLAAVSGDLAESALKRSAGVKDSGGIIPGRGGALDSIDSLAMAAPVFYIVYRLLFV
ncbi:phosphatidate cytidylyltransferase [Spirochaetia bacterium]|nr:phosphatidate cytidylyltransferase [Spirochaetia bacterium]